MVDPAAGGGQTFDRAAERRQKVARGASPCHYPHRLRPLGHFRGYAGGWPPREVLSEPWRRQEPAFSAVFRRKDVGNDKGASPGNANAAEPSPPSLKCIYSPEGATESCRDGSVAPSGLIEMGNGHGCCA